MAISITREASSFGGNFIKILDTTSGINNAISMGFKKLEYTNPSFTLIDEETNFRLDFVRADISVPISSDDNDLYTKLNNILY